MIKSLSASQIDTVIKNIPQHFKIDTITKGEVIVNTKGKPWCSRGGLCCVYKFRMTNGEIKAIRIWTTLLDDHKKRSLEISKYITENKPQYFLNFKYIEDAFLKDGELYPIILMDWCDGVDIKEFLVANLNDEKKVQTLADNLLLMFKYLYKLGIAHGDLHHENIRVNNDLSLQLIDYDSLCIPSLSSLPDSCGGYDGYQHPTARSINKILSPKIDYFSELILYLSILAIKERPFLWSQFNVDNNDKSFLFKRNDFFDLRKSAVFNELSILSDKIKSLLNILEQYLYKRAIDDLEPFYIVAQRIGLRLPSLIESHYCIYCGSMFENDSDNYCVKCGTKRCDL